MHFTLELLLLRTLLALLEIFEIPAFLALHASIELLVLLVQLEHVIIEFTENPKKVNL